MRRAVACRLLLAAGGWPRRLRRGLRQAGVPDLRHRPHGRGAAGGRGAARQQVKATFFLANERTQHRRQQPGRQWAPWWRARAAEGHAFGSHTWDHDSWLADVARRPLRVKPSQGPQAGKARTLDAGSYCAELQRPAQRFQAMTGQPMQALFRAPGGKTSPACWPRRAAAAGRTWAGRPPASWATNCPASAPQRPQLLKQALRDIRAGDILVAHLGIWSRRDPGRRRCWSR
jgi:peptidoglycan-N-acetylmuramic acid deacetylase